MVNDDAANEVVHFIGGTCMSWSLKKGKKVNRERKEKERKKEWERKIDRIESDSLWFFIWWWHTVKQSLKFTSSCLDIGTTIDADEYTSSAIIILFMFMQEIN
ncbi:hypothetical protein RJT34_12660 [Clitoria ternatea]|uniref:Uncharacterized protein n=1 Tax=Clitoria ternatea TaxID=43366 RepID=A0AAN9JM46_CLITE